MNALKKLLAMTGIILLFNGCGQKQSDIDSATSMQDSLSNHENLIQKESLGESNDLINAVLENDLEKAQTLLSEGADVHQKDARGWTPIHNAVYEDHLEMATLLLKYGADVNAKTLCGPDYEGYRMDRYTPLIVATPHGQLETIQYLIEHGANVNDKEDLGNTALHYAASNGNLATAEYLIKHGADVNASNTHGDTPLLEAIVGREYEHAIVELLLNNGANINARNDQQETCLLKALNYNFDTDLISYFVKQGADIHAVDYYGNNVLHLAIDYYDTDVLSLLLTYNVDINHKKGFADENGNRCDETPLMLAATKGKPDMVKILLDKGADKHIKNQHQETVLDLAHTMLKSAETSDDKTIAMNCKEILQLLDHSNDELSQYA